MDSDSLPQTSPASSQAIESEKDFKVARPCARHVRGASSCCMPCGLTRLAAAIIPDDTLPGEKTMDAAELRALQAPIKERYKSDPSAAVVTLKAKGSIDTENLTCKVETGRALAVAGLHPATGGSGLELCSGDMLLEALVACAGVTMKSVATAIEVPLKKGIVIAEGDLDFRGTLGVDKEAPVGFEEIRLRFEVSTDAPQDKLDLLLKLTERYCVVYQTIKNGPKVSVSMKRI
jgi:uncharacterized OsmC-like protein